MALQVPLEEPPAPSCPTGPLTVPPAGAHTAQEGIKDPEEGAQASDSQHQDGTTGLHRPGKAPPLLGLAHDVRGGPSLRSDGLSSSRQEPLTLQPDAMLLWLTLALLWSPTCWAQRKSGWGSPQPIPLGAPLPPSRAGVWASPCHRRTLLSGLSPRRRGCVLPGPTYHCVFIFFLFPTWFFHVIEIFGPGGGDYFNTSRDFQTISPGFIQFERKLDNTFAASCDDIEKVLTRVYGQCTVQSITHISFDRNYPSN
ncbi:hypothetical protein G4228_007079 [Cervus hanglu yarkandensis]|nr:hypothetical protein G4228_007079 [Cervus hanglu yarkandensis]